MSPVAVAVRVGSHKFGIGSYITVAFVYLNAIGNPRGEAILVSLSNRIALTETELPYLRHPQASDCNVSPDQVPNMRIHYKGGVWKNSEDEILKAAVMKYGQNQWARIASLLVRKSAKQCKARWYEWLDPAIKKTQWTREEEEKLLHLVKIMPTQWRTIAPMIGRTAAQCIEHYEKLIDQAQQHTSDDGPAASPSDPKSTAIAASRQRPGDLDAVPESKPARPDPVDMDDDELEMLSEARARLANTKGKKAKRKAREKQLEVAKRVAQLQKRRELKAAGVPIKPPRKSRKVTDYATEIPFERPAAPGFYDTREEDERAAKIMTDKKQIGKLLQKYMGPTEAEKEEEARRKDTAKRARLEKTDIPTAIGLNRVMASVSAPRSPPLKRKRFSLSPPQLSDADLEKLANIGVNPVAISNMSARNATNGNESEQQPYVSSRPRWAQSVVRAPHATPGESWAATRKRHIETIMALKSAETPLRGGENAPLSSLGLNDGVTPATFDLRTPNPLATPSVLTTASHDITSSINESRKRKAKQRELRDIIRRGFAALPEPDNEYELDLGEQDPASNGDEETSVEGELIEDAEEEEQRSRLAAENKITSARKYLLSTAASRDLPLPSEVPNGKSGLETVSYLIERDLRVMKIMSGSRDSLAVADEAAKALKNLADEYDGDSDTERANALVDEFIAKDERSKEFQKELLDALEGREEEMASSKMKLPLASEESAVIDVSLRNGEKFREEREERRKEQEELFQRYGRAPEDETCRARELWQALGLQITKEIAGVEEEESLSSLLTDMRSRILNAEIPASLSEIH